MSIAPEDACRPLVTRADDFGVSPGTNEAILECLDAGFIRNVGVMVPGPFLAHRLDELIARQGGFCLGLHATLNSEWARLRWGPVLPASEVSSLVELDGTFHRTTMTLNERGVVAEMLREVEAQLARLRHLGLHPRYLDTHMGFSWVNGMAEALAGLCRREGLLFADDSVYRNLSLPLNAQTTAGQIREAAKTLAEEDAGIRAAWVFHPAKRDACSERFYTEDSSPSTEAAEARYGEYLVLANAFTVAELMHGSGIQPAPYCR